MVAYSELREDREQPLQADLAKEVERLRLELALAEGGFAVPQDSQERDQTPSLLAGFQSPDDFVVRNQTLKYTNGDTYEGETLGSLRHGRGVHTCSSGDVYEGQWRYDKRDGRGKMTFVRGLKYEGEWKEDKAHGQGAAQYENGGVYVGEFAGDVRQGWGTHYFPGGDKYEGEWAADRITGKGRYTYAADGSYYEGEWRDGGRVKGKLVAGDGSSEYSGGWKDGLRHGYGVEFQRGLFKYMGQWEADLRHGEGKCVYVDGSQYDGEWRAGLRHGKGKLAAGSYRYEGEWREDRQHGAGMCHTQEGDKYVGEFQEGKQHGQGRCLYADGSKYEGQWENGLRHGQGTCLYANGDKYQGGWQAGKRHGYSVCKFADGRKFRGDWEDDGWLQSAADPEHCRVAGPGVTRAVAGQQAELVIEARDDRGCKRLTGGDEFQVSVLGPGGAAVTGEVEDAGDGSYRVRYTATVAGVYELSITVGAQEHVAQSPYPLRVLPGRPAARRAAVEGPGRSAARAGLPAEFAVEAHDEYGNRWSGDAAQLAALLPLEASLSCGSAEVAVAVEAARDGRFLCRYTAPTPGFWRLHVTCRGQPLPRTPFSVQVTEAGTAGTASTAGAAAASPAPGAAEGAGAGHGPVTAAEGGGELAGAPAPAPTLPLPPPVEDRSRVWAEIAAAAFAADGSIEGWDSDGEGRRNKESGEEKYLKAHPGVPVVENLEDLWLVSRLQRERKLKEERDKAARLQGMRSQLEQAFGPPQLPTEAEVAAAVQEIVAADVAAQRQTAGAGPQGPAEGAGSSAPAAAAPAAAGAAARPASVGPAVVVRRGGRAGLRAAAEALAQLD